jgi:hypothetical protein
MANFAIDIDDTLYDFGIKIREEFFKMAIEFGNKELLKGAYAPHLEWRSLTDSLDIDIVSSAISRVHSEESILSQKPYENSVETINLLSERGHELKYISSRKESCKPATLEWLQREGFAQAADDKLLCVSGEKKEYLKDTQYLIDDRPSTVANFVNDYDWQREKGKTQTRKAFGLWFPYNQALTDIANVYLAPSWIGIKYYLERKI